LQRIYPPKRFLNEEEFSAQDKNAKYYIPTMLTPFVLGYICFNTVRSSIIGGLSIVMWMYLADYFHTGYHKKGFWMEKYGWFMFLREIHFIHHSGDMLSNMGVVDFFADWVLGILATPT